MSLFQCKQKDGTVSLLVTGYVTKDPRVFEKDGKPTVASFSVCYGSKKYMDAKVWSGRKEAFAMAQCLEAHDNVLITGEYEEYQGKDGKTYTRIDTDFISVMQLPVASEEPTEESPQTSNGGFEEIEEEEEGTIPF